jgi:2-polyprenyl-6-methoxyphenol hydroxylase-like FAD-dependent oxidoreductase
MNTAVATDPLTTDVLIIGAGPTGLMLANQLGRRGIRALIIDRHSGPAQQTRAMAVHARTLEIYSKLGVADQALALGRRGTGANLWADGQQRARIPLSDIGRDLSLYPFVLMLGQDDNERILGANLSRFDLAIEWNTELIALKPEPGFVTATVRLNDRGIREIRAAYVAGCDGARSAVRELNGIAFPGAPYEHVFFVADTEATGPMVQGELNVYLWRDGFHLFFPMRGHNRWRVIGILPTRFRDEPNLKFETLVPAIRDEAGAELQFQSCSWLSTYRIHHRCTERFRKDRCFLLGDAAHVHSPMGGQGMNTGLQDAYNLAWKLALVIEGRADDALLDTYEAERMQIAQRLLATTDRAFRLLVADNRIAGLFRTRVFAKIAAFAMRFDRTQMLAFQTLSMLGIRYPQSLLSRTLGQQPDAAPHAGDRFPWLHLNFEPGSPTQDLFERLDDTRFNLIVVGQTAPDDVTRLLGTLMQVHVIPDDATNARELTRVGIQGPAFYLLRPDGHIGLIGSHLQAADIRRWMVESHIHADLSVPAITDIPLAAYR